MAKFVSEAEHALKGTEPRPRLATVINTTIAGGRPTCPRHLSKGARKQWLIAVKIMEARGTLDPSAGPCLELYAVIRDRYLQAQAVLDKEGLQIVVTRRSSKGDPYEMEVDNPYLKIAQNCEDSLQQLTKILGIAPDAREKVKKVKAMPRPGALPSWYVPPPAKEQD